MKTNSTHYQWIKSSIAVWWWLFGAAYLSIFLVSKHLLCNLKLKVQDQVNPMKVQMILLISVKIQWRHSSHSRSNHEGFLDIGFTPCPPTVPSPWRSPLPTEMCLYKSETQDSVFLPGTVQTQMWICWCSDTKLGGAFLPHISQYCWHFNHVSVLFDIITSSLYLLCWVRFTKIWC